MSIFIINYRFTSSTSLLLFICLLISGCGLLRQKNTDIETSYPIQSNFELTHWQLKGKLIFKSPEQKFSAYLNWIQKADHTQLRLTNFLGISILILKQDDQGAHLEYQNKAYYAANLNELLNRHTHLNWPIEQMSDWIKGIHQHTNHLASPQHALDQFSLLDNHGSTWTINYPSAQLIENAGLYYRLPTQVNFKNTRISIKIKIQQWIIE